LVTSGPVVQTAGEVSSSQSVWVVHAVAIPSSFQWPVAGTSQERVVVWPAFTAHARPSVLHAEVSCAEQALKKAGGVVVGQGAAR